MCAALRGEGLARRLGELGAELQARRALWRHAAFREPVLPWEREWPRLAAALRALDEETVEGFQDDHAALDAFLGEWLPVARWNRLAEVGCADARAPAPWPHSFERDVPGRKWKQILAFLGALDDADALPFTEWCAGKAHLGRAAHVQFGQRALRALEIDPALVGEAAALARRRHTPIAISRCDVLDDAVLEYLDAPTHVLALHACGMLHRRLLECAVSRVLPALSLAPCCYHLGMGASYHPLSRAAGAQRLELGRDDVRSAVQETVTAPGHARRQRRQAQQWQLGFDALQRRLRASDGYLPPPPVDARARAEGFAYYCRAALGRFGLELPADFDAPAWAARGSARFREVSALDLVRQRLRRLLELWLVLDRALFLAEHGYHADVSEFCLRDVTPRNLLIRARRA